MCVRQFFLFDLHSLSGDTKTIRTRVAHLHNLPTTIHDRNRPSWVSGWPTWSETGAEGGWAGWNDTRILFCFPLGAGLDREYDTLNAHGSTQKTHTHTSFVGRESLDCVWRWFDVRDAPPRARDAMTELSEWNVCGAIGLSKWLSANDSSAEQMWSVLKSGFWSDGCAHYGSC